MINMSYLNNLYKSREFESLLSVISSLPTFHLSPTLLVMKGCAIQLCDKEPFIFTLEDAESSFKEAIKLDPLYIDAYLELGFFYLNVQNDPKKALLILTDASKILDNINNELNNALELTKADLESF